MSACVQLKTCLVFFLLQYYFGSSYAVEHADVFPTEMAATTAQSDGGDPNKKYNMKTSEENRASKQLRGALILTMAGTGAPSYLQASCLSIRAAASGFDMLIFHENNEQIINMPCAENVKKINVQRHGLARLITKAVCQHATANKGGHSDGVEEYQIKNSTFSRSSLSSSTCQQHLETVVSSVLSELPYYLAEFKIGVRCTYYWCHQNMFTYKRSST